MSISKTLPVSRCEYARALLVAHRNALLRFLDSLPTDRDLTMTEIRCLLLEEANNRDDDAALPIWNQDPTDPVARKAATDIIEITLKDRHPSG